MNVFILAKIRGDKSMASNKKTQKPKKREVNIKPQKVKKMIKIKKV